jgi:anti-sigma regulatory factor (Ser/Thr protein kinase)
VLPQREPPYDDFVFNLRASYQDEAEGLVDHFIRLRRTKIAIFYQADAYGRGGWEGVRNALERRGLRIQGEATYRRDTASSANLKQQVNILKATDPDAIISIGSYAACAAFIRDARDSGWNVPIANVSFVGSGLMADLLVEFGSAKGRDYESNLVNSQVVPSYENLSLPAVKEYRQRMDEYGEKVPPPGDASDYRPLQYSFISFEGFLNAKLLVKLLNDLGRDNDSCMFVTMFCGILNVQTGGVEFSNAGHNLPYVVSNGTVTALTNPGGMALGVADSANLRAGHIVLSAGDRLVLYTDGVTEAMDKSEEFFSQGRLETTLQDGSAQSCKAVIERVVSEVRRFCTGAPQADDDMTLLVLGYMGPKKPEQSTVSVRLRNDLSEIQRLNQIVGEFAVQHNLAAELTFRVNLVLEEIVANVISYGYDDRLEHDISVRLSWQDPRIELEVKDDGRPFNPLDAPQPEIESPLVEKPVGGLGIHLVRRMVDHLEYRREGDKNCFVLRTQTRV